MEYADNKLHVACIEGDLCKVDSALAEGADINLIINGFTPLINAILYNRMDMIKYLCDKGANVNACVKGGYTPLDFAEMYFDDAVEFLRSQGALSYYEKNGNE